MCKQIQNIVTVNITKMTTQHVCVSRMVLLHMAVDMLVQWWLMFIVRWCMEESFYTLLMSRVQRARWADGTSTTSNYLIFSDILCQVALKCTHKLSCAFILNHLSLCLFLSAEAAVWMQPHGLYHGAGRRHGHNRIHECFGHPAHHNPPTSPCGPWIPWRCARISVHLQEA